MSVCKWRHSAIRVIFGVKGHRDGKEISEFCAVFLLTQPPRNHFIMRRTLILKLNSLHNNLVALVFTFLVKFQALINNDK